MSKTKEELQQRIGKLEQHIQRLEKNLAMTRIRAENAEERIYNSMQQQQQPVKGKVKQKEEE